ncbi:NUDIX hydrolase [Egbenema bharatensis]|uniref:NUDIX hydrolase n=1 Tax=Egbenema bharatensis TaxID=3463334 RepID=UPI003A83DDAA
MTTLPNPLDALQAVSSSNPLRIRVITLGLIQREDCLLVSEGYDSLEQQAFYRMLGGGVEFGETSLEALQREFREELQAELTNIQYLGCLENLFTYQGQPGHELVQLYRCDLSDPHLYEQESLMGYEGTEPFEARWIEGERFQSGMLRLVPERCLEFF